MRVSLNISSPINLDFIEGNNFAETPIDAKARENGPCLAERRRKSFCNQLNSRASVSLKRNF